MKNKKFITTIAVIAATYAVIYFYQRYQRMKADENVTPARDADEIIKDL